MLLKLTSSRLLLPILGLFLNKSIMVFFLELCFDAAIEFIGDGMLQTNEFPIRVFKEEILF